MRYSTNTIKKWKDRHYGSNKKNLHKIIDTTNKMLILTIFIFRILSYTNLGI